MYVNCLFVLQLFEKDSLRSYPRRLLAVVGVLLLFSSSAYAHKVNMFAFAEGDRIFVEGYFSDGKRAQHGDIVVFDHNNKELVRGKTDKAGNFSFKIPVKDDLRISLNAGMGHKTGYVISKAELAGLPATVTATKDAQVDESRQGEVPAGQRMTTAAGGDVSPVMIRRAVGKAIMPLMRSISELKERSSFSDLIGGIGFIVGVLGVFFYIKAKKLMAKGEQKSSPL